MPSEDVVPVEDAAVQSTNIFKDSKASGASTGYLKEDEDKSYYSDSYAEDAEDVAGTDAYGRPMPEISEEGNIANIFEYSSAPVEVLGLPLYFTPLSDSGNRCYSKMFEESSPIVFLNPGLPKLNKKIKDINADTGEIKLSKFRFNIKNFNDTRFLSFRSAYGDYYNYFITMLRQIYTGMGLKGIFKLESEYQPADFGMAYFANRATSISEEADSSYGQSQLASNATQNSQETREAAMYTEMDDAGKNDFFKNIKNTLEDLVDSLPLIGNIISPMAKMLSGSQLYYPEIWADSSFGRSYTLSFKFYSPYGDRESIFRNVYVPFISLLAMVLPRQDGVYGYREPFLVRASCPGYFECECGVITSFSFVRGGDDMLWTAEGLPNEITCSLTIKDLYPSMPMPEDEKYIKYNGGMLSFLSCMSGVRMDQMSTIMTRMKTKSMSELGELSDIINLRHLKNRAKDTEYSAVQWLNNIFT